MNETITAARGAINDTTEYVLYLPNIDHLGKHKKKIWKLINRKDKEVTIKSITSKDSFKTKLENIVDIRIIAKHGYLNAVVIAGDSLHEYKQIEKDRVNELSDEVDRVATMHRSHQRDYGMQLTQNSNKFGSEVIYTDQAPYGNNPCSEIKLNDKVECSLPYDEDEPKDKPKTGAEMNTSISGTINKNTDAAKQAAIVVAGSTLNNLIAVRMGKQLPRKYRKLANHPMANIVIANMASFAVQNFAAGNYKAQVAADAMMTAAMQDFLRSFNIEQIIAEVLDSVNINNLVED
jgi:hypothetical protein